MFFACTFVAFGIQCFGFFTAGQGVENARSELRDALAAFKWQNSMVMTAEDHVDLEVMLHDRVLDVFLMLSRCHPPLQLLQHCLCNPPAPVSPYGFFSLNHSGFLGATAVVVTYLIVLVQFRQSEI